ncbi:bromodomain-containing protein [Rhizophagus clarus]|uniref:Bromodomain-containing protein n=1 Tax=Rhizophagus clarus TaxID=94130 RepID=A0A8H3QMB8_9GLOM|nr:bromodomain-containing protein [Rhizophagus clarus]
MPVVTSFPKKTSKDQSAMITIVTSLSKEIIEQNLTIASLPKKTVKTSVENFSNTLQSNKLINFCYDIFHKLENNPYAYLFYKYNEKDIIDKAIKHPMDLFTVNSKLENDQYTNLEEFENNIRLIFRNCYTYNDAKSEVYCSAQ